MTWHPDHPGGTAVCDANGCERKRRMYCPPEQRDKWEAVMVGDRVRDFCPDHNQTRGQS